MNDRVVTMAAAALLLSAAAAQVQGQAQAPMNAERGWSAIGQCAGRSERDRHACMDDVLRQAGLLTPAAEASDRRRQFGLEGEPARVPAPTPAPAMPTPPAVRTAPTTPAQSAPPAETASGTAERLQVEVVRATTGTDGKIVLTTADGAVWRQLDSDTIRQVPRAGDRISIRKASLGSYLCSLPSQITFRCRRTQ